MGVLGDWVPYNNNHSVLKRLHLFTLMFVMVPGTAKEIFSWIKQVEYLYTHNHENLV